MSGFLMGLVYYYDFTRAQREVMLNLADHAHDDGTSCRPSLDVLNWKTKSDRRNVQKTLRSLEALGVLVPVAYPQGGRGRATEYEIHLLSGPLKPTPPPSDGMRKIWEMLKGGAITAVSDEEATENSGAITAVSTKTQKGGNSRTKRAVIHAQRAVIHAEKGGAITAPTIKNHHMNHQEEPAHTREASLAEKENEQAEPEPEPEPPPLRDAPPAFNEFARGYRREHGIDSRYSEIYRAYQDYCAALEIDEVEA